MSDTSTDRTMKRVTIFDIVLIVLIIAVSLTILPFMQRNKPSGVQVYKNNTLYAEYPLYVDRTFTVAGHDGPMVVKIKDGKVSIESSCCREQICVKMGTINKSYQQLVCAPNHVIIEVTGKGEDDHIDAIAQ